MTFTEAAAQVLRLVGKPLHYKEITDVAIEKDLLSHVGKSPEVTMGARLAALVKKGDKENPLVRIKPGVFALREWDKDTIEKGLADRTPALKRIEALSVEGEPPTRGVERSVETASESNPDASVPSQPRHGLDDEDLADVDVELRARAELAANATQLFAPEEDDDEPILGSDEDDEEAERADEGPGGRRRRRRRRRRGGNGDDLPTYTVSDAPAQVGEELAETAESAEVMPPPRRDRDNRDREGRDRESREGRDRMGRDRESREGRDRESREARDRESREGRDREEGPALTEPPGMPGEDLTGAPLADAIFGLFRGFERGGAVPLRQLADAARKRVRLSVDGNQAPGLLLAAMRADNMRRAAAGERPRFRLGGGRAALTEWAMDGETRRLERELTTLAGRFRDASRRALLRKLTELPPRAFSELVTVLLEQAGVTHLAPVKLRAAAPGELHYSGKLRGAATDLRLAIVVRREGRDVGRERVNELRGTMHHYDGATAGWIVTTGQVLSGAREEAALPGAAPVRLLDGTELARLCEQNGVGVVPLRIDLAVPDAELFEGLRSG